MAELHVLALSGGKDSTAMALRLVELHPDIDFTPVCTPTGNEPEALFKHWELLEGMIGKPILHITGEFSLVGLIAKTRRLPNWRERWCTRMLKIEPYAAWLIQQKAKHNRVISYVGLRADEEEREGGDYSNVPGVEMRFPMREWGWGIDDVWAYLQKRGITIPERTDCKVCFFQKLGEWYNLWRDDPEGWAQGEALEELTGHTFRSDGRDTWPASMKEMRERFERGEKPERSLAMMDKFKNSKCRVCRL